MNEIIRSVEPVEGEDYDGRQYGYRIVGERWTYRVSTGGTGECWNISVDEDDQPLHICDLGDFIEALILLRDSPAHAEHVARWA